MVVILPFTFLVNTVHMIETSYRTHWTYDTATGLVSSKKTILYGKIMTAEGRKWAENLFFLVTSISFDFVDSCRHITFHYGSNLKYTFPVCLAKVPKGMKPRRVCGAIKSKSSCLNVADKSLQLDNLNVKLTGEVLDNHFDAHRYTLEELSKIWGTVSRCSLEIVYLRPMVRVSFKLQSTFIVLPVASIM